MTIKLSGQHLSMRFEERVLFHIPELSIGPNDAIYLTGGNGVGKTTLLKILSGLLTPSSGSVSLPKRNLWQRMFGASRPDVIYLHQSPYLFDGSVYDNVAYGLKYRKKNESSETDSCTHAKIINALRMVGLETLAKEHVCVLSGGERQRVAMARAWVLKPSILLMDEPSASLDDESVSRIVAMAKDLLASGASIVITSHQRNALTDLCRKQWSISELTLKETPILHIVKEESTSPSHIKAL
ncbi:energy-coupling factor ABC transporter ATP-binding protein [Vibrio maerlii]|uniref:energy-coupling factor ABC transporter ATP-binding protein n=1 Tax=Vibrio maerlii TaxID=2231648 RepID=UPI000E3D0ACC|nr:energy-coupling factor ABC transporter ATP-binding protein [Vibrio maerlii]